MNLRERQVMEKVYACINRMSGLGPTNPADLRAKAEAFDMMSRASAQLTRALGCLNYGDIADAHERADEAKQILRIRD